MASDPVRPVRVTVMLEYDYGAIPGRNKLFVTHHMRDDTPELLKLALLIAYGQIDDHLRAPMRPCGYPAPWAGRTDRYEELTFPPGDRVASPESLGVGSIGRLSVSSDGFRPFEISASARLG